MGTVEPRTLALENAVAELVQAHLVGFLQLLGNGPPHCVQADDVIREFLVALLIEEVAIGSLIRRQAALDLFDMAVGLNIPNKYHILVPMRPVLMITGITT